MGNTTPPRHVRATRPALHVVRARAGERIHPAIARSAIVRHWAAAQIAWADVLAQFGALRLLTAPTSRSTKTPALARDELAYLSAAARNMAADLTRCADELDLAVDVYDRIDPNHPGLTGPADGGPDGPTQIG